MSESITQVWTELEAALGRTLSDTERDTWLDFALLYINKKCNWDTLCNTIRSALIAYGQMFETRELRQPLQDACAASNQTSGKESIGCPTRTQMLIKIIAAHAGEDPEVIRFRDEVLQGRFVPWSEMQAWITHEHERERHLGLPRVYLKVPLPPSYDLHTGAQGGLIPDPPLHVDETHPAWGFHRESLDYAIPGSDWVQRIPIAYGGTLARLQQIATTLAQRYQWQPSTATVFILTGLIPALQSIRVSYNWSEFQTDAGNVTALSRIILTIEPTLTPKDVSTAFQRLRRHILGAHWRDLGDWQLALVQFALDREDTESWQERLKAWNKVVSKEWRYDTASNFKRACENAIEKLLAPISSTNFFSQREDNRAETPRQS